MSIDTDSVKERVHYKKNETVHKIKTTTKGDSKNLLMSFKKFNYHSYNLFYAFKLVGIKNRKNKPNFF